MWCDYWAHYAVVTPKVNTTCVTIVARHGYNVGPASDYALQTFALSVQLFVVMTFFLLDFFFCKNNISPAGLL